MKEKIYRILDEITFHCPFCRNKRLELLKMLHNKEDEKLMLCLKCLSCNKESPRVINLNLTTYFKLK